MPAADNLIFTPATVPTPPEGWVLLPPGDAALTRRVKAAGPSWSVQEKRGRKVFSQGTWADGNTVTRVREELLAERATEGFARRLTQSRQRRVEAQAAYVEDFEAAVRGFLRFDPRYASLESRLARLVSEHATPVGSGTVARTERIPIEQRAEAAVIAWMRHQTTGYDEMVIPRVKGKRREVRRMLAARSQQLLGAYRRGEATAADCPLSLVLASSRESEA